MRGMVNSNQPDNANPQSMPTNNGEPPQVSSMGEPKVLATISEPITSMESSMLTHSIDYTGPILNFTGPMDPS